MGTKKSVTKEMILDAGMAIVRNGEANKINARFLAKSLSISTQPIYDCFINMENFKHALLNYIRSFYYSFVNENRKEGDSLYFQYIQSYLRFAHEYPYLFQYIFVNHSRLETAEEKNFNEAIVKGIMKAGDYSFEAAKSFFLESWIFAHGIAMQLSQKYIDWDFDTVIHLLNDNFEALKMFYKGK